VVCGAVARALLAWLASTSTSSAIRAMAWQVRCTSICDSECDKEISFARWLLLLWPWNSNSYTHTHRIRDLRGLFML
jgi:hypothetical protein